MCFTLGAALVKVILSGYNYHRPHYDGGDVRTRGHRKPVSMHTEMHVIFSSRPGVTGISPSFCMQKRGRAHVAPSSPVANTGQRMRDSANNPTATAFITKAV